jgi:ABC-type phosphate/phosphonate transport system substrate-binding protein
MRKTFPYVLASLLALCSMASTLPAAELKLGVNAPRGELIAKTHWAALAEYLTNQLGQPVALVPVKPADIMPQAQAGKLDLILGQGVQTVHLQEKLGAIPTATLNGKEGPQFAGVIVARKGTGITTAKDLKGKKVMALDKGTAGAYLFQAHYLHKQGIDPHTDFAALIEGKKQDDLVLAVKAGLVDAAFVRSGLLESMAKEGKIALADFVVVDARQNGDFPIIHSTDLYPEWYLSVMPQVAPEVLARIKTALLHLTADMPAARSADVQGFVEPLPLDGIKEALRLLKMPPYDA